MFVPSSPHVVIIAVIFTLHPWLIVNLPHWILLRRVKKDRLLVVALVNLLVGRMIQSALTG